jgi:Zn-dependent M28 family amino/carboxypeptidase
MIALLAWPALGLLLVATAAQPPRPDAARIKADLEFLCSPDLTGRETGTPGAEKAAAYVADRMRVAGLTPIKAGGMGGATPYHYQWTYTGGFRPGAPVTRAWDEGASDVVGVVPGTEPALAGEYVFITAHYDHLGTSWGTMYPGADDNASGTAGLLALMDLLRQAQPRRSLAFLAVSGEEEGLLGSEAFLQDPPLPVATIKAEINMDMIGRGRKGELHVMPARQDGAVTTLTEDARAIASRQGLPLSAGIEQHWRDSDHYSFARRGIPSICFNTGLHADYHQPTDTPDKIDYGKLTAVVAIIRDLVMTTANAPAPPALVPKAVWKTWVWAPFESPLLPLGQAQ